MSNLSFEYILADHAPSSLIDSILELKSVYWKYPISSQRHWWNSNTTASDQLFYILSDQQFIAFTRVRLLSVQDQQSQFTAFNLSEICVSPHYCNKGIGSYLISNILAHLSPSLNSQCFPFLISNQANYLFYQKLSFSKYNNSVFTKKSSTAYSPLDSSSSFLYIGQHLSSSRKLWIDSSFF